MWLLRVWLSGMSSAFIGLSAKRQPDIAEKAMECR
jgi:hypothetical protein